MKNLKLKERETKFQYDKVPGLSSTSKNTITGISHDQDGRPDRLLVCSKRHYHVVDLKKSNFDEITQGKELLNLTCRPLCDYLLLKLEN